MNLDSSFVKFASNVTIFMSAESDKDIISRFYDELVSDLAVRHSIQDYQIEQAIGCLVGHYRYMRCGRSPKSCEYNNISYCIGYLHQYASCHSRMVYTVIYELWRSSLMEIFYLRIKSTVGVTFIGSGPGNDFVGFLNAIHGYCGFLRHLNVTIVDKVEHWERVVLATDEKLRNGGCGKAGKMYKIVDVRVSFLQSDVTKSLGFDHQLQTNLKATDVVFLVKVMSTVPDENNRMVFTNIVQSMKPGAILIFIDCPFPAELSTFKNSLREIYQNLDNRYTCSSKTRFGYQSISRCRADVKVYARI